MLIQLHAAHVVMLMTGMWTIVLGEETPRFRINLDLPPGQRFVEVATHFKDMARFLPALLKYMTKTIPASKHEALKRGEDFLPREMVLEIKGIAETLQTDVLPLLALNLGFEAQHLHSSALVVKCLWPNGTSDNIHARALQSHDSYTAPYIRDAIILLEFTRNGNVIFSGISFAFFVGLLTGQRHNGYSVSVNSNPDDKSSIEDRINWAMAWGRPKLPVGFAVRWALDEIQDYAAAAEYFQRELMASPAWITISGIGGLSNLSSCTVVKSLSHEKLSPLRTDVNEIAKTDGVPLPEPQTTNAARALLNATSFPLDVWKNGCGQRSVDVLMSCIVKDKPNTVFTTIMRAEFPDAMFKETFVWKV